jgi:hypothetical protein
MCIYFFLEKSKVENFVKKKDVTHNPGVLLLGDNYST